MHWSIGDVIAMAQFRMQYSKGIGPRKALIEITLSIFWVACASYIF